MRYSSSDVDQTTHIRNDVIELLIKKRAGIKKEDDRGNSPWNLCTPIGQRQLEKMLDIYRDTSISHASTQVFYRANTQVPRNLPQVKLNITLVRARKKNENRAFYLKI